MSEVIVIVMIVLVLNRIRNQYQSNVALKYQYKFDALQDRLHWEVASGKIDRESETCHFLNYMIETVGDRLPDMSIWTMVGELLTSKPDLVAQRYRATLEARIYRDPASSAIYQEANRLWLECMQARHKYSLFAALTAMLPLIGLAQLYNRFRNKTENKMQVCGLGPMVTSP